MTPKLLNGVLESLGVPFSIVADLKSGEINWIGESESVDKTDLISAIFADEETARGFCDSLEGQVLPRIWGQGQITCVVCKPTDSILIGLFVKEDRDVIEMSEWAEKADEAIQRVFLKSSG